MTARIDLQQFCSRDELRWYIHKPFRFGHYIYATDGHIVVRVAVVAGDLENSNDQVRRWMRHEKVDKILRAQADATFAPLRVSLPAPKTRKCEDCVGSGAIDGDKCDNCEGVGRCEQETSVSVAGVFFAAKYIRQIAALPDPEFPTNPSPAIGKTAVPCPFRFAGGVGSLMPMSSEGRVHLGELDQFRVAP